MNRVKLTIAISLLFVSCGQGYKDGFVTEVYIDLCQKDCKSIEEKIKTISLIKFVIDDSWKYIFTPLMTKTDSSFVFCNQNTNHLLIYDLSGNKRVEKHIKGRGRGEVLGINDVFSNGKTICIYDGSIGNLLYYDDNGNYKSKWSVKSCDDLLYSINDNSTFVGLYSFRNDGNNYVAVYDKQGKTTEKFFSLPKYLKDNPVRFGLTPNSYIYKDTVRFFLPFDYNIFSVTNNSSVSTYKFIPENPIPSSLLTQDSGADGSSELLSLVLKDGYDSMFQSLFETDRYLFFKYFSNGKYKCCLFDKIVKNLYRKEYPDKFYNKGMVSNMTESDVWQYLIYGFTPLYAEGNDLYGQISYATYNMLKECSDKLDDRMNSLMNNIGQYIIENNLQKDDVIIIKISFEN